MDDSMEKVLLVRGWKKGASWSFPRGKINRDEKDLDCAIREVYEETGYDLRAAGLVSYNAQDGDVKAIDITMREQHMRLFVFRGVPLDTHFEPRTRREIGGIEWYNVKDLPGFKRNKGQPGHGLNDAMSTKFYMVAPFLGHLKKWIGQQLKRGAHPAAARHGHSLSISDYDVNAIATEDETDTGNTSGTSTFNHHPGAIGPHFPTGHANQGSSHAGSDLLAMLNGTRLATAANPAWPQPGPGIVEQPDRYGDVSGQIFEADSAQIPYHTLRDSTGQQAVQRGPMQFHDQQGVQHHSSYDTSIASGHLASQPQMLNQLQPSLGPQAALPSHIQRDQWNQGCLSNLSPNLQSHQSVDSHLSRTNRAEAHPAQQNIPLGQLFGQSQSQSSTLLGLLTQPNASQSTSHSAANPLYDTIKSGNRSLDQNGSRGPPNSLPQYSTPGQFANPTTQNNSFQRVNDQNLPPVLQPQGEIGPLAVGPPIPEESTLPTKTLNMHAAKLLDAFKIANAGKAEGDGRPAGSATAPGPSVQKPNNQHQSALLGLLQNAKVSDPKASSSTTPDAIKPQERAVSPALTDKTETPLPRKPRDRTAAGQHPPKAVPALTKSVAESKAAPVAQQPQASASPRNVARKEQSKRAAPPSANPPAATKIVELSTSAARPKSRGQLFDPSKPSKSSSAVTPSAKGEVPQSLVNSDARTASKGTSRASANLSRQRQPSSAQQPTPQFSILQRPGSAAGKTSVPASPLRNESSKAGGFQPQLLKRPAGEAESTSAIPGKTPEVHPQTSTDKRDNLLALFGKTAASPSIQATKTPSPPPPVSAAVREPAPTINQKDKLLNLFSAKSPTLSVVSTAPSSRIALSPSVAPQLHPETRSSSRQSQQTNSSASQQHLLNLFNSNTNLNAAPKPVMSPGTPMLPFALGTPAITRALPNLGGAPTSKPQHQQQQQQPLHMSLPDLIAPPPAKSRVGSLQPSSASISGGLASGQQTPTAPTATPSEAKNFLLDYLNGVVQKEGGEKAKARGF
jgi:mRNA-decapping enzyme subunit 2